MPAPQIAIIGAGIAGMLMGIKLRQIGIESFRIYEKASDVGGTWRDNTYPGLSCDIPAHLYVYTFAPNPDWSSHFAAGPEIQQHYRRVAEHYGVLDHVQFECELVSAKWRDGRWDLRFADGSESVADIVVGCVGRLHHPAYPDIEGLERFAGPRFHSARWDHDVPIDGRRVGLIGTGSSATQIIGALADRVATLKVFQRTAQWVLPWPNPSYSRLQKAAFRFVPFANRYYYRKLAKQIGEVSESILVEGEGRARMAAMCKAALAQVRDPALRAKLTPDYRPGCKRIVISPNFYEAIQKPTVELVTDNIDGVEPEGVRTADGKLHEIDVLVMATGFKTQVYLRPIAVTGQNGVTLDDVWADGPLSYKSVAIPGMPNFFMVNGPYGPNGSASVVGVIEVHVDYVMKCIEKVLANGQAISPCPNKSAELITEIRGRGAQTLWATGGCKSWYLDEHGIPLVNPLTLDQLRADMSVPCFEDFVAEPLEQTARRA